MGYGDLVGYGDLCSLVKFGIEIQSQSSTTLCGTLPNSGHTHTRTQGSLSSSRRFSGPSFDRSAVLSASDARALSDYFIASSEHHQLSRKKAQGSLLVRSNINFGKAQTVGFLRSPGRDHLRTVCSLFTSSTREASCMPFAQDLGARVFVDGTPLDLWP